MTADELIRILQSVTPDTLIVLSPDADCVAFFPVLKAVPCNYTPATPAYGTIAPGPVNAIMLRPRD